MNKSLEFNQQIHNFWSGYVPVKYNKPNTLLSQFVEPDAIDLMPTPFGMAARVPTAFLTKKALSKQLKETQILKWLQDRTEKVMKLSESLRNYGLLPSGAKPFEFIDAPLKSQDEFFQKIVGPIDLAENALLQHLSKEAIVKVNRGRDALDLWRLRNMGLERAIRQSTDAGSLEDWAFK